MFEGFRVNNNSHIWQLYLYYFYCSFAMLHSLCMAYVICSIALDAIPQYIITHETRCHCMLKRVNIQMELKSSICRLNRLDSKVFCPLLLRINLSGYECLWSMRACCIGVKETELMLGRKEWTHSVRSSCLF